MENKRDTHDFKLTKLQSEVLKKDNSLKTVTKTVESSAKNKDNNIKHQENVNIVQDVSFGTAEVRKTSDISISSQMGTIEKSPNKKETVRLGFQASLRSSSGSDESPNQEQGTRKLSARENQVQPFIMW